MHKKIRYSQNFLYFVPCYLWYIIHLSATYWCPPSQASYLHCLQGCDDHCTDHRCWRGVQGELIGKPKEIIIITEEKMLGPLQELVNADPSRICILTVTSDYNITIFSIGLKSFTFINKLLSPCSRPTPFTQH